MKKSNFFTSVLAIVIAVVFISCSDNDNAGDEQRFSSIEQKFNASKISTLGHNLMLENMYTALEDNPIRVKGRIYENEKELDACIRLFIDANKGYTNDCVTRASNNQSLDFSYLKDIVLENRAFTDSNLGTRAAVDGLEYPKFLTLFYDEFFESENLDINNLDSEILECIDKVMITYPNLTEEEQEGLAFVAGVIYNSCIYWDENAGKWERLLADKEMTRGWLWDGIKNGTKKWVKADGGGAISAWVNCKIAGIASGGTVLLAGAAVGSVVGAWDNLPCWD